MDQLVLDELPDDPGHLVAVELDDGILDFDLRHFNEPPFQRGPATAFGLAENRALSEAPPQSRRPRSIGFLVVKVEWT